MLTSPANSAHGTEGAGYKKLADNLESFNKINSLPGSLKLSRLDEGQGIEVPFRLHKAKWHDSCRLKINIIKLKRAEKRKMLEESDPEPRSCKFTRMSREHTTYSTETCFFYGRCGPGDALCNASTFDVDFHVRQCALKVQGKPLLAKLMLEILLLKRGKVLPSVSRLSVQQGKATESHVDSINHGVAFAGLVSYIEEVCMDSLVAPVFKLTDLVRIHNFVKFSHCPLKLHCHCAA